MYHEITAKDKKRKRNRRLLVAALVVAFVIAGAFVANLVRLGSREQGAAAIRQAILDSAIRCCAIEGAYPLTIEHLEDDYGLRVNHDDYIITYEAYASNIAPSVVVVPR